MRNKVELVIRKPCNVTQNKSYIPIELTTRCSSELFLQEGKRSAELIFYLNGLGVRALIYIKIMKFVRWKL